MSPARSVGAMFGRIAGAYDFLNHLLSFGMDYSWRGELAALAEQGRSGLILDLAAGTLDVAIALHKMWPDARISAMDFCPPMLARGCSKLDNKEKALRIMPCVADALALPAKDNCASCVTMAFGIRNITPRIEAFKEMLRVLVPGGKACILEFGSGQERIWGGIYNLYLLRILPLVGKMVAHDDDAYAYLSRTIREFPSAPVLAQEMEQAGFSRVNYRKLTSGIVCLHWGQKPDSL